MLTKRSLVVLLIGVNLLLAAVLVIGSYSLPAAYAQTTARPGDFICVTAKTQAQAYDVFYILDVPHRKLHALYPSNIQTRQHDYAGFRDLSMDFGRRNP